AVASKGIDKAVVGAVLDDWRTAPVNEKIRATLGFLERLTLEPASVGADDIVPLRRAGVSDRAIEDAIRVCAMFNVVDRLADALGFELLSERSNARAGSFLLRLGYH
ncbi:MAG: hypothetical protein ACREQJ_06845, partial [Candidatus Binatia bacterium]